MPGDLGQGESPQVNAWRVVSIAACIIVLLVVIAFGFQLIFRDRIGQTFTVSRPFPQPAVIRDERAERLALEAKQKRDLNGAGGRRPIDAAMQAIAAKGEHAFDPVGGGP
jgi:hypothetical protein